MSNQQVVSAQHTAVQLPGRFQCSICKVFKNIEHYSNNELKGAQWKKNLDPSLNGRSARIRCRLCTGSQRHELECVMCGNTKELSKFSKSSRKAGGTHWCIDCTAYKEVAAPDVQRGGTLPQEDFETTLVIRRGQSGGQGWEEAIASDEFDRASLSIAPTFTRGRRPNSIHPVTGQRSAPELGRASTHSPFPGLKDYVPPHLRGPGGLPNEDNRSVSSASNLFEDLQSAASTSEYGSEWEPIDSRRRPSRSFNAWGPDGEQQIRMGSGPPSAARTLIGSGRANPAATPAANTAPAPSGRANAWAKPENCRPTVQPPRGPPQRFPDNNREDPESDYDGY